LFVVIAILSSINVALRKPIITQNEERDLLFSGVVIDEDRREYGTKLFLNLNKLIVGGDTIDFRLPVQFYTIDEETYFGKNLLIEGKIRTSRVSHQPNILTGKIVNSSLAAGFSSRIFYRIRNYIDLLFKFLFNKDENNIVNGLILGGSSRLGKALQDVFVRAGVLHILSVSGLHVGFVISFVSLLLIPFPFSAKIKFFIVLLVLFIYAGITGFRPPVLRAGLMAFLFGVALVFQRKVDSIHVLNMTAFTLLIMNPLIFFDISAQLSFASVYGILYLYPKIERLCRASIKQRFLRFIALSVVVSFSAQLFITPLLIHYFQRTQTIACLSNLLIVPLSSIITYLLFICIIVSAIYFPLTKIFVFLISPLISLLVLISKFFANISFSSIQLFLPPIFLILAFFLFTDRYRKFSIFAILITAIIFSIASFSNPVVIKISENGSLLSLPEGDNIFITSKGNAQFLANQGVDKLDYLIAPRKIYPASKEFIQFPEELHFKRINIRKVSIELCKSPLIKYCNKIFNLDKFIPLSGEMNYIITNGKNMYIFKVPLYRSIVDQIVTDFKIIHAKIKLLL